MLKDGEREVETRDLKETLKELSGLPGVSGYEECVGRYMLQKLSLHCSHVQTDTAGNLTGKISAKRPGAKKVMVFAHMDSLGFVVKRIDGKGFLRVERLGGVPEKILPGLEVLVKNRRGEWLNAVIGNKSHHVTAPDEKYRVTPLDELYVDLGLESSEEALELGIAPGCPVAYKPRFTDLGGGKCYGTAMDNRGGCAILLDLAGKLAGRPCDLEVYLTATVQEEFNLRGALTACASIKPDFAIAMDVAITGDTPDMAGKLPVSIGKGPVMSMYNFHGRGTLNGTIPHPALVQLAEKAAGSLQMPLQRFASGGILTDASYVQLYDKGVPIVDLGFPCRYTHTAVELCSVKDLAGLSRLVEEMLRQAPPDIDFTRTYGEKTPAVK